MQKESFEESVQRICERDDRYDTDAYFFVRESLDFVTKRIAEKDRTPLRHVSGKELLNGFRDYALQEFGPMTLAVLHSWGIHKTEDIGAIVFNLVEAGKLGKTDDDRIEDFSDSYDFDKAFSDPFKPEAHRPNGQKGKANRK